MSGDCRPRVLVNWGGTVGGGGRTYLVGFVEELAANGSRGCRWEFIAAPEAVRAISGNGIATGTWLEAVRSVPLRVAWEQVVLPFKARRRADVLVSAANFGPLAYKGRHIVIAQNALYFSSGVGQPTGARFALETKLARASVGRADYVVVASDTMKQAVAPYVRGRLKTIPFGPGIARKDPVRKPNRDGKKVFLHPTPYGPHKNLATILRATAQVAAERPNSFVVKSACDPAVPFAVQFSQSAVERELLQDPVVSAHVQFYSTGATLQRSIAADAIVVASEVESFCFPLVEGLAAGVPVIAADVQFAREICGSGADFFDPQSPTALATAMRALIDGDRSPGDSGVTTRLSWKRHVDAIAELCVGHS